MKTKLNQVFIAVFLTVLVGSSAVANSQIKDDLAYAFGSLEGFDSGNIALLSPREMDETEGLFLGWLIRTVPRMYRYIIKDVVPKIIDARKKHVDVWVRVGKSYSNSGDFKTYAIRWGSNQRNRDKKLKNDTLKMLNYELHRLKIPLRTWRTNDPGHLHLWKRRSNPDSNSLNSGPSSLAAKDDWIFTPNLHRGEGGMIDTIDWETITAEDLLTGRFDEAVLTEAATGPTGTGWGMEDITERQARLGLSILLFVADPENNVGIDIPLHLNWEYLRMAIHLRKNPVKNGRAARLARLGLKQLRYIINQHNENYHPPWETPDVVSLSASESSPAERTYLPIQAHWWMHDFSSR